MYWFKGFYSILTTLLLNILTILRIDAGKYPDQWQPIYSIPAEMDKSTYYIQDLVFFCLFLLFPMRGGRDYTEEGYRSIDKLWGVGVWRRGYFNGVDQVEECILGPNLRVLAIFSCLNLQISLILHIMKDNMISNRQW